MALLPHLWFGGFIMSIHALEKNGRMSAPAMSVAFLNPQVVAPPK